eukprot:TRINITY_DN15308_c0_g1_i1.p1 TRINITY_DN15308_c0_g1~~TRINITY_DN15308_c0_g1_i1.p1  ORF type:complete len:217 (-),score=12.74 TRINITY_DN15308_c0_g1_i1:642-1292(-)
MKGFKKVKKETNKFVERQEKTFKKITQGEGTHESRAFQKELAEFGINGNVFQHPIKTVEKAIYGETSKSSESEIKNFFDILEAAKAQTEVAPEPIIVTETVLPEAENTVAITEEAIVSSPTPESSAAVESVQPTKLTKEELLFKAKNYKEDHSEKTKKEITDSIEDYKADVKQLIIDALNQEEINDECIDDIIWGIEHPQGSENEIFNELTGDIDG